MALYKDTSLALLLGSDAKEYFRFEGGKTNSRFEVEKNHNEGYIYVSGSIDHHMYFSVKRIKQILNKMLLEEEQLPFTYANLRNPEVYPRIKDLVLYDGSLVTMHSFRLGTCPTMDTLLRENAVLPTKREDERSFPKRVDRRVYGGGYGLGDEWKRLFADLTYYTASTSISRKDLLELLINMKVTGKSTQKDNIRFLLTDKNRYQYHINKNVESDFHKYSIIDALESILERGEVREDSSLAENPKKTIKSVVEEYERGREKTLSLLEKNSGSLK